MTLLRVCGTLPGFTATLSGVTRTRPVVTVTPPGAAKPSRGVKRFSGGDMNTPQRGTMARPLDTTVHTESKNFPVGWCPRARWYGEVG